ncbi:outer membrane protein assembly factor BamA [Ponticoccus sp. SC2-23]|uniref:outer membrane protein assembly factor BamA n=1 Tax=Alexandriicola marinus TaxID=2081710 RepID=UPI000FD8459D|nr:outer membrane protein assembly factor BamA [Alexandriicola marinus]MBM1218917.1 outer membrane protein assembly factor BamA [Ponticoccus sp. SC6-9]MBM1224011.1 outer membrane protein assembly factor BamA [Ponticoccus sp. SC6-15]MBM1230210.1 outer membrane protein assembly factor BamA [Ponticoccus sp. SC6-38]MBM1232977.1 outer membrane protein assembly factor BamA [Ponticoccus sp. SC6-45]MBM1237073.1 outer membrane protein assembly factor BamA [Ponticoccus sp. SC6-49]MBM1241988.1 outer mem
MTRILGAVADAAIRLTRLWAVLTLAIASVLLSPEHVAAQTFQFSSIQVEGNQRVGDAAVINFAGLNTGQALSGGELNDAAQAIRATGLFETVDLIPQGGRLVIRVSEYPTINRINFEGNRRVSDAELETVVGSRERRVYSPAQAEADVRAITQAYANEGRINAVVTPAIIRRADNRVDLVFEITEGGITEIERISFVGNRSFGDYRLRGVLESKQAGLLRALVGRDTFIADRIAADRRMLTDFYLSRGYADFQVLNVDVALTRDREAYLITFNVQEGQQFRFGDVSLSTTIPEASAEEFEAVLRTRPGAVYSPETVDQDIERLERLALRQGINFLTVEPRITRDDRNLLLNVEYVLVRGERLFVERIDIEGNNTTLDRVVRSQFDIVEGDPFNPRAIRQAAERIRALSFFGATDVNTREGSAPDQVVVDVNVIEAPTGSLSFGANYSTDFGVSLLASYRERNFLGRGQNLSFELSTGASNRVLAFNFAEPQLLGRDLRFSFGLDYRTTDNQNALYDTETFRVTPALRFPVSENGRLTVFYAAEYTDITDVSGERTDAPADRASLLIFDEADEGGVWTNSLGYSYSFDTRREGIDPTAGILFRFGQELGVGDSNFLRTSALIAAEARVLREDVTLRAVLEGGVLNYFDGASRVTDRYFMGSSVMRGFEPGGIGPRDAATDDALGGEIFAVARLEAQFPIGLPEEYGISGGAFVDYGSLWSVGDLRSLSEADVLYNDFTPRAVGGLSIFWETPIGPLRFNFTEPLLAEEFDRPKSFDLTVSTSF